MASDRGKVVRWVTRGGRRVPVFEDGTLGEAEPEEAPTTEELPESKPDRRLPNRATDEEVNKGG